MDKRPMVPADPMEAVLAQDDTLPSDVEPQTEDPSQSRAFAENEGLAGERARKASDIEGADARKREAAAEAAQRGHTA